MEKHKYLGGGVVADLQQGVVRLRVQSAKEDGTFEETIFLGVEAMKNLAIFVCENVVFEGKSPKR